LRFWTALAAATALVALNPSSASAQYAPRHGAEPNDTITQASGPLLAGAGYSDTLETNNDRDTFFFYTTKANAQLSVQVANTTADPYPGFRVQVEVLNAQGARETVQSVEPGQSPTIAFTLAQAGKHYLQVIATGAGDGPRSYTFTATAGGLLVGYDPARCAAAYKRATQASRSAAATKRRLTTARRTHQPTSALKRRAAASSRRAADAKRTAAVACTNPPTTTALRAGGPIATAAAQPVIGASIRMDWTGSFPKGVGTVIIAADVSNASRVTVSMIGRTTRATPSGRGRWQGTFHNSAVTEYAGKPKPRTVKIKACNGSGCTSATRTLYPPALPPGAPA
jgi:hypothetical protein